MKYIYNFDLSTYIPPALPLIALFLTIVVLYILIIALLLAYERIAPPPHALLFESTDESMVNAPCSSKIAPPLSERRVGA